MTRLNYNAYVAVSYSWLTCSIISIPVLFIPSLFIQLLRQTVNLCLVSDTVLGTKDTGVNKQTPVPSGVYSAWEADSKQSE